MSDKKALNIHQRILGVMSELDYIQKGAKTVNNQYRYASHDQVTAALHPYLVKYGITVIPTVLEMTQEGNRTVVKLGVSFNNVDNPTEGFSVIYFGYGVDAGDKGPGKAISYAFKYACLKVFCLETGEDSDQDANAVYKPVNCLEFDQHLSIMEFSPKDLAKLDKFLLNCSEVMGKHVEDVKREALKKMPEFLAKFDKWVPKKEKE